MIQDPYRSARRVFWLVANGSPHRGGTAADGRKEEHPNLVAVPTPVHASPLGQQAIPFGIVQLKELAPAAHDLWQLEHRILAFEARARTRALTFARRFTRHEFERGVHELAV
ncbi:MAG: hypothetical protein ACYDHB_03545 [Candidatus Dormibacteria bacterium]